MAGDGFDSGSDALQLFDEMTSDPIEIKSQLRKVENNYTLRRRMPAREKRERRMMDR